MIKRGHLDVPVIGITRGSWKLDTSKEDDMRLGVATDHGGFGLKEDLVL
jgi:hypothetical protein